MGGEGREQGGEGGGGVRGRGVGMGRKVLEGGREGEKGMEEVVGE